MKKVLLLSVFILTIITHYSQSTEFVDLDRTFNPRSTRCIGSIDSLAIWHDNKVNDLVILNLQTKKVSTSNHISAMIKSNFSEAPSFHIQSQDKKIISLNFSQENKKTWKKGKFSILIGMFNAPNFELSNTKTINLDCNFNIERAFSFKSRNSNYFLIKLDGTDFNSNLKRSKLFLYNKDFEIIHQIDNDEMHIELGHAVLLDDKGSIISVNGWKNIIHIYDSQNNWKLKTEKIDFNTGNAEYPTCVLKYINLYYDNNNDLIIIGQRLLTKTDKKGRLEAGPVSRDLLYLKINSNNYEILDYQNPSLPHTEDSQAMFNLHPLSDGGFVYISQKFESYVDHINNNGRVYIFGEINIIKFGQDLTIDWSDEIPVKIKRTYDGFQHIVPYVGFKSYINNGKINIWFNGASEPNITILDRTAMNLWYMTYDLNTGEYIMNDIYQTTNQAKVDKITYTPKYFQFFSDVNKLVMIGGKPIKSQYHQTIKNTKIKVIDSSDSFK